MPLNLKKLLITNHTYNNRLKLEITIKNNHKEKTLNQITKSKWHNKQPNLKINEALRPMQSENFNLLMSFSYDTILTEQDSI